MADPEKTIIDLIDGNGGWVEDTNLFRGPMLPDENHGSPIPREAAFVLLTGGPPPINLAAGGASPQEYEFNVQIMIRGEPDKYKATQTKGEAIYALVHDTDPAGWISVRTTAPYPLHLGQDERRSHVFVINVRLLICE